MNFFTRRSFKCYPGLELVNPSALFRQTPSANSFNFKGQIAISRFSALKNLQVRQRNAAEHGEKRKKLNEETRLGIIERRKKSKTRYHDQYHKHHEHARRRLRGAPQFPCTAQAEQSVQPHQCSEKPEARVSQVAMTPILEVALVWKRKQLAAERIMI